MKIKLILAIGFMLASGINVSAASSEIKAATDERLINYADVDEVHYVPSKITKLDTDVKYFSFSGGDPALNGSYLNIAIFADLELGWKVYSLANVSNYKLLPSQKPGVLRFKITRDYLDKDGNVAQQVSTLLVHLKNGKNGTIETQEVK